MAPRTSAEDGPNLTVNAVRLSETSVTVTKLYGVTLQNLEDLTASVAAASDLVFNRYTAVTELTSFPQRVRSAQNIMTLLLDGRILWKKTCGKTTNEMGRQQQEVNGKERRRLAGDVRIWN